MSKQEFRELRKRNFRTQKACGIWLHYATRQVERWEAGYTPVPWTVATLMRLLDDGTITKELEG